jgi:hypothetical protein
MSTERQYRSVFWPILLIGAGIFWLLNNLNLLPAWSWGTVWQLWPVFLIAIGLDLMVARRSPILGAIVALGTIGLILALILTGTFLGSQKDPSVITEQFSEELGSADSARIALEFSVGPAQLEALQNSNDLFQAEITHIGEVEFSSSGTSRKTIQLDTRELSFNSAWFDLVNEKELKWDVGISPEIPVALDINGGVGEVELDLSELQLTGLDLNIGVGKFYIFLPSTIESYDAKIVGSVGETLIEIAEGADIRLDIEGGVGEVIIDLPEDAAVRLDASIGVGRVRVPSHFRQVQGGDSDFVGEDGVWETSGFDSADRRIIIQFDGGVGGLILR